MTKLESLLEQLQIPTGSLVYLHTSFSRLRHLELGPDDFLETLLDYLGPKGTLVLPSFSWNLDRTGRPWKGYQNYFDSTPVFDVTNTPANIGVLPELFRHRPGVVRSLSYWWSVSAHGPLSTEITRRQETVEHPYGPDSSFGQIKEHGGYILGLGVTLNTTSLAFVPDYDLGNRAHLTPDLRVGLVVDASGHPHQTRSHWVLPQAVQHVKPQEVFRSDFELLTHTRRCDHGEVIQFAYPYAAFHKEALRQGRAAAVQGQPYPWWNACPELCVYPSCVEAEP